MIYYNFIIIFNNFLDGIGNTSREPAIVVVVLTLHAPVLCVSQCSIFTPVLYMYTSVVCLYLIVSEHSYSQKTLASFLYNYKCIILNYLNEL